MIDCKVDIAELVSALGWVGSDFCKSFRSSMVFRLQSACKVEAWRLLEFNLYDCCKPCRQQDRARQGILCKVGH